MVRFALFLLVSACAHRPPAVLVDQSPYGGDVSFTVIDGRGLPIVGALVTIRDPSGATAILERRTDDTGRFTLDAGMAGCGEYTWWFDPVGFPDQHGGVDVWCRRRDSSWDDR